MNATTIPAPAERHPIDVPRFSTLLDALRAPKLPSDVGPYEALKGVK